MPGVLATGPGRSGRIGRTAGWLAGYLALSVTIGGLTGVLWWRLVKLPTYVVGSGGGAATTERGLAEFFAADAWFCVLGLVVGAGLGLVGWRWFGSIGWPVAALAVLGGLAAALVCWLVGYQLGPGEFSPRLAAARPGDRVPIELTIRAKASLAVWPFAAVIPVLLGSSLGPDAEEPRPLFRRRRPPSLKRKWSQTTG